MDENDNVTDLGVERVRRRVPDLNVVCPRCGKSNFMRDTRCQHCGLWFLGEAFQFAPPEESPGRRRRMLALMARAAVAVLVAFAIAAIVVLLTGAAAAPVPLPPNFTVPSGFVATPQAHGYADFDTLDVQQRGPGGKLQSKTIEGHIWRFELKPSSPMKGDAAMKTIEQSLAAHGWTIERNEGALFARRMVDGHEEWYRSYPNSSVSVVAESAPMKRQVTLAPPAAEPESVADDRDFPFFTRFDGETLKRTGHETTNLEVRLTASAPATLLTATPRKFYAMPPEVSNYEYVHLYKPSLERAGWNIARSAVGSDGVILAHYARNGRDVWLYTRSQGDQADVEIADVGAQAAAARLDEQLTAAGHVALYGIYFDTDSPTPKSESESTLLQVFKLLQSHPALRLEIQGHTDNSGAAEHNAKLSSDRAASVKQWLVSHGIATARLASKGYGATRPVADNNSAEGKAKNRRVELAKM